MSKLNLKKAKRIKTSNGEVLKLKVGNFLWQKNTYDVSTQAVIDFANTKGFALPTNLKALNDLIVGMKTIDIWNDLDRFWLFSGDGSSDFKRINLIDPNKPLADFYGGLTISNSGIKGNGTNAYIDTNFNPQTQGEKMQPSDCSISFVCDFVTDNFLSSAKNKATNATGTANANAFRIATGTITSTINYNADTSGTGFKSLNRTSTTDIGIISKEQLFNRTQDGGISFESLNQVILKSFINYREHRVNCFIMGKSITYEKSQDFRTIFNKYLYSIGLTPIA